MINTHDSAAGWGLAASKVSALLNYANTHLSAADFENCYLVDYILDANDDNYDLLMSLVKHPEYFGNHIEDIRFVIKNISLESVMVMGANKDSVKINCNGIDYVRFKDEDFIEDIMQHRMKKLTVYGRGNLNYFNNRYSVQIFIDDYELEDDSHKYDF